MPPRDAGFSIGRARGPVLTPRGREAVALVLALAVAALFAWGAVDPSVWSAR